MKWKIIVLQLDTQSLQQKSMVSKCDNIGLRALRSRIHTLCNMIWICFKEINQKGFVVLKKNNQIVDDLPVK